MFKLRIYDKNNSTIDEDYCYMFSEDIHECELWTYVDRNWDVKYV